MSETPKKDQAREFRRLADQAASALLRMESFAARGLVTVPAASVPYVLRDLRQARENVRLIQSEVENEMEDAS
jgi:hypothetical protein